MARTSATVIRAPRVIRAPPIANNSTSNGRNPRQKRSKCGTKAPRKRKNCMDAVERRRQLEADPWTLDVLATAVECKGCKRWIKLDQRNEFYAGLWTKHRNLCKGVLILKGVPLPKRTRRSKKTVLAAAVVAERAGSGIPSMAGPVTSNVDRAASANPSSFTTSPSPSPVVSSFHSTLASASAPVSPVLSSPSSPYPAGYQSIPMYGVFPGYEPGSNTPDTECRSSTCHHRFRFSTRREIRTYFNGATVASMARDYKAPRGYGDER
ncbi:hypothetical protein C0991_007435 [Blastosporella zonata]|nr:hypothetical protein C0991_007435 [Blastosporella zonata]